MGAAGGGAGPGAPAVPIEQSVTDDYIVCLEDGRRLKTLKRYIQRRYSLRPGSISYPLGLARKAPIRRLSVTDWRRRR
jgi:MucR family transcriptional regulator, transcriptional regulator of exopolysaccharide biosynthesis